MKKKVSQHRSQTRDPVGQIYWFVIILVFLHNKENSSWALGEKSTIDRSFPQKSGVKWRVSQFHGKGVLILPSWKKLQVIERRKYTGRRFQSWSLKGMKDDGWLLYEGFGKMSLNHWTLFVSIFKNQLMTYGTTDYLKSNSLKRMIKNKWIPLLTEQQKIKDCDSWIFKQVHRHQELKALLGKSIWHHQCSKIIDNYLWLSNIVLELLTTWGLVTVLSK